MKLFLVLCLSLIVSLPFISSCTALRPGSSVKPGFDVEAQKGGFDSAAAEGGFEDTAAESGWAAKYIPGWGRVSKLLPPPTEARKKWDNRKSPGHESQNGEMTGWY